MPQAVVYSLPGRLYLDPPSAAQGGDELSGIDGRRIVFDTGRRTRTVKGGLEQDNFRVIAERSGPGVLTVPVLGDTVQLMRTLFGLTDDGAGNASSGDVVRDGEIPQALAIILRPDDTGADGWLYSPAWRLHPESAARVLWHPVEPRFDGTELKLLAGKLPGLPAWRKGAMQLIEDEYFEGIQPPGDLSITEIQ